MGHGEHDAAIVACDDEMLANEPDGEYFSDRWYRIV